MWGRGVLVPPPQGSPCPQSCPGQLLSTSAAGFSEEGPQSTAPPYAHLLPHEGLRPGLHCSPESGRRIHTHIPLHSHTNGPRFESRRPLWSRETAMNRQMGGKADKWADQWTDRQAEMDGWTGGRWDRWMDKRQTDRSKVTKVEGWMDDGWMNRQK